MPERKEYFECTITPPRSCTETDHGMCGAGDEEEECPHRKMWVVETVSQEEAPGIKYD